ncbi:glycosyltransferase family 2 protein [Candidatus Pacearchaeota archaeon]|nr:glycosyltransferase family 2 protein [Candidatus Pacearchaeota archaeon]
MAPETISVIIITIARQSLYRTLTGLFSQKVSKPFEVVLVLQGSLDQKKLDTIKKQGNTLHIIQQPFGLGFGHYRNVGIKQARGDILAFIDDDEWPKNNFWLEKITRSIRNDTCQVTTAGYEIPLTGRYLTDCISFLGYPGGANVGFDKMWSVSPDGWTEHLCSGNFAFSRKTGVFFNESLRSGSEDVDFGKQLSDRHIRIRYVPEATLWHEPRSGFKDVIKWFFKRGKSLYEYTQYSTVDASQVSDKKKAIKNIFRNVLLTKYLPGLAILFIVQNVSFLCGYFYSKMRGKS